MREEERGRERERDKHLHLIATNFEKCNQTSVWPDFGGSMCANF